MSQDTKSGSCGAGGFSLQDFLPYRMSVATNLTSQAIARAYEQLFGLRIPEWRIIAVLAEESGLNQQAIAARTRMDKLVVSRGAAALVDRGLIERRSSPVDGRAQQLLLTTRGRDLHAAIVPKARELEGAIFASFAPEQLAAFDAMLRRIEANALAVLSAPSGGG